MLARNPRVWKFELQPGITEVKPEGKYVTPLHVAWDPNGEEKLWLWAEVSDPPPADVLKLFSGMEPKGIWLEAVPTGGDVPTGEYLGTATGGPSSMLSPSMVMHVYWGHLR